MIDLIWKNKKWICETCGYISQIKKENIHINCPNCKTSQKNECCHRGKILFEKRLRLGCEATQPIYSCPIHGECTLRWHGWKYMACDRCGDYEAVASSDPAN